VVLLAASNRFTGAQSYALTVGFSPQMGLIWKPCYLKIRNLPRPTAVFEIASTVMDILFVESGFGGMNKIF